jgi:thiol-disulfide isomerase/thioredoxin
MNRIKTEDSLFLAGLKTDSYVHWYLPLRKLVSSVSTIAQYRTKEIPAAMTSFRKIDYTDNRLYHSGLLRDVIDSHFWLLENSGRSLDSVYVEMKKSIDCMVNSLLGNDTRMNEITEYLFKLLERRSLFQASEYLALRLLNEKSCTLHNDFASQLESYRAMKKGNIAPEIAFAPDIIAPGYNPAAIPRKLADIQNKYTIIVFGASWCNACVDELNAITGLYHKWKSNGFEVVFVSLDDNKQAFSSFAAKFPFISVCDFKKWESPVVKNYHIFASPTMFLLDYKREIILRPNSAKHVDAWIDWFLKKT